MQEYILPVIGFVSGGGITAFFSMRYLKRTAKFDFADRSIAFAESQEKKIYQRFEKLEKRVAYLEEISCLKNDCTNRKTAI